MMLCPECNGPTIVRDSRPVIHLNYIRRRRECMYCHARFTTYEFRVETAYGNASLTGAIDHIKRALASLESQVISSEDMDKWLEEHK